MGGCFYNGGGGFFKSLQIIGREVPTPLFYENPFIAYPLFQILYNLSPQIPCHLQSPPLLFFLLWIMWIYTC